MNPEELMKHIQGIRGNQSQQVKPDPIPVEKLDEFISKCLERDETLFTISQSLQWSLQRTPMISFPELEVYPQILKRIQQRAEGGEV